MYSSVNKGNKFKNIFYEEGIHDLYFDSQIDNTVKKMDCTCTAKL